MEDNGTTKYHDEVEQCGQSWQSSEGVICKFELRIKVIQMKSESYNEMAPSRD